MLVAATSIVALFAAGTSALVLPRDECADVREYQNLVQSAPFSPAAVMATSFTCTSTPEDNCELSKGVGHSVGVSWSVSGSIDVGFDLGKVFSLGASVGFEYGWSTEDESSQEATVICPAGGIECGAQVTSKLVTITGQTRIPPGGLGCAGDNDWHDFTITAPQKETNNPEDQAMSFSACLMSCGSAQYPESCDVAYGGTTGGSIIPICPSKSTAPCQGSFGGTCGTVPAMN